MAAHVTRHVEYLGIEHKHLPAGCPEVSGKVERKREDGLRYGEIETAHPGYLGSQDAFYVGTMKGVGGICQQNLVDTYSKGAAAKFYTSKTPITSADLLNDRGLPFFEEHGMGVLQILTDRGTEARPNNTTMSCS